MKLDEMDELKLERSPKEVWDQALELLAKRVKGGTFNAFICTIALQQLTAEEAVIAVANDFTKNRIGEKELFDEIRGAICRVLGREIALKLVVDPTIKPAASQASNSNQQLSQLSIAAISVRPPRQDATIDGGIGENTESPFNSSPQPTSHGPHVSFPAQPQTHPAQAALTSDRPLSQPISSYQQDMRFQASNLNAKYTLEKFVVGSHNRFCYSAAMAVAERPGETYNPLFIYGGVGLGKTHIMQAVGHHVMTTSPKAVVRYITCERFTNDLVNSIRENRMIEFRKRYRQADVLLVDDIQFIEGKESTQEEFFHTFNSLRDSGRQIILSSDRPPKEIPKLEERLRSRFEWGLIADMQAPDLETRLAILRKKSEADRMNVTGDVLEYIASVFKNNIRELEGALLRAHAYTSLTGTPLNIQTAANVLQVGAAVPQKPNLTVENIISAVATHYRLDTSDLRSAKRSKDLALPRHIAMFLAHDILGISHSRIGESLGNRKHSSVIYAIDKIKEEILVNVQLSQAVQQIRRQLGV